MANNLIFFLILTFLQKLAIFIKNVLWQIFKLKLIEGSVSFRNEKN